MADATVPCPICAKPVATAADMRPESFPFCSQRCRLRDLGAWLDGRYALPGRPLEEDDLREAGDPG